MLSNGFPSLTSSFFDISISEISGCQTFSRHRPSHRHICSRLALDQIQSQGPMWEDVFVVVFRSVLSGNCRRCRLGDNNGESIAFFISGGFICNKIKLVFLGTSACPRCSDPCTRRQAVTVWALFTVIVSFASGRTHDGLMRTLTMH